MASQPTYLLDSPLAGQALDGTSSEATAISRYTVQPPTKPRKRKAPTLRESDWEPYKDRITDLYTSGAPLKRVREAMEADFGFHAEYVPAHSYVYYMASLTRAPGYGNTDLALANGS